MTKILLVEDEIGISNIERSYLEKEGFEVVQAFDGQEALDLYERDSFDLILLDLMLPKVPGEKVLSTIRAKSNIPILLVTAKVEEEDRIAGLRYGADDYITKPFSPREMVERVKAILRRVNPEDMPRAEVIRTADGRIELDLSNNRLTKDQHEVALTRNEFLIVKTLFSNPLKIFTREEIIEIAFGFDYEAYDRAIDTHIKNIRQKLEDDPKKPKYIKTVYGMGYKASGFDEVKN